MLPLCSRCGRFWPPSFVPPVVIVAAIFGRPRPPVVIVAAVFGRPRPPVVIVAAIYGCPSRVSSQPSMAALPVFRRSQVWLPPSSSLF